LVVIKTQLLDKFHSQKSSEMPTLSTLESRCERCDPSKCLYQCFACKDLDKGLKQSRKEAAKKERHTKRACTEEGKKQQLFLERVRAQFEIKNVPRDGHCVFHAFAAGYNKLKGTELTMQEVRNAVADFLVASDGFVSISAEFNYKVTDEAIRPLRASEQQAIKKKTKLKRMSVEEYAAKVRGKLYGGDAEIAAMAQKYEVQVHVYSWLTFDGSNVFGPQKFNSNCANNGTVSMLFEQDFINDSGAEDHYDTVLADKFQKWREYMVAMPKWSRDICVCTHDLRGRGIKALRDFKKGDVLLFYDGHRVDPKTRKLGFESSFLKDLYFWHLFDPEAEPFHATHALRLGRRHCTDFVIDGYPTTLEKFDHVDFMGRAAMANSASTKDSNMRCVWVRSPNFAPDVIEKIADCECFMVARRDIK
jgi:hypothetical protein